MTGMISALTAQAVLNKAVSAMKSRFALSLFLAGALLTGNAMAQQQPAPLTVPGVAGLDQRVLTRPYAKLTAQPGATDGRALPVFSHFFVFERRMAGGKEWLRVGANRRAQPAGWVAAEATAPWRQAIVLAFNQAAERQPVLFFENKEQVEAVATHPDRAAHATTLAAQAKANPNAPPAGVIALEPRPVADFRSSFYLLPILDFAEVQVPGVRRRGGAKLVKVASITRPSAEQPVAAAPPPPPAFKTGVVFVIDTTRSMEKYIDRTRKMVRQITERIARSPVGGDVSFGMVAFRGKTKGRPELEYVTRIAHPLQTRFDPAAFQRAVDELKEAKVSTAGFAEDGLAGVNAALAMPGWNEFAARFIIVISDAPVLEAGDPNATTDATAKDIATKAGAADRMTAIMSVLLETQEGQRYHAQARSQYSRLSYFGPTGQTYAFPIPGGDVSSYGDRIDAAADAVVSMTEQGRQGALQPPSAATNRPADPAAAAVFDAGYAMQLAWLGARRQTRAPTVAEGWAIDIDLAGQQGRPAFDVNVLLTRNQLNDLYQALGAIDQTASARLDAPGGSRSFFAQLRQVLATAQTDPTALQSLDPNFGGAQAPNPERVSSLQDLVAGFIRALPYQSALLSQTPENLEALGPAQLSELRSNIRSKKAIYKSYFDDADRWIKLTPDTLKEDEVYPVPLSLLP
jgi:serine/threonine-protein kinase PpkA